MFGDMYYIDTVVLLDQVTVAKMYSPYELAEIVMKTDADGILLKITGMYSGNISEWDYRDFDLEYCNVFFKGNVWEIQNAYEAYE